ncbi:hypothetical protein [Terriglobus albidus]|uniref:hypothetical protein n=1 Tax=Terriglobus albidus TaxID=1592106 RepID=UPI0021DF49D5|nr:hypothetical protein [Terriglobus albidus]
MIKLAAIRSVCFALLCAAPMAHAAAAGTETGNGFDLSIEPALQQMQPSLHITHSLVLPYVREDFSYNGKANAAAESRWSALARRFGSRAYFPLSPPTSLSAAHPGFAQIGALPLYADGMLRRFPQAPENSSMRIRDFNVGFSTRTLLSIGMSVLDRANGVVAAIGLSTRFGRISVERGESKSFGSTFSMKPVTVFRFDLAR